MRYRFIVLALVYGFLLAACYAQPTSEFQSVSGDNGRSLLNSFLTQSTKPDENKSSGLWSWGNAPKGSKIVGGKLVADTIYNLTSAKIYTNWLGDTYVDPSTGSPIYSYEDPSTGRTIYYYIDPKNGEPISVNVDPFTGEPVDASLSPYSTSNLGSNSALPSIFSTNNPWS